MAKYSGKIQKKRRKPAEKVYQPTTHAYNYESKKEDRGVLKKTVGFDSLSGTKKEKRGRKKGDTNGKARTSGSKVRNRRSNKQSKAKRGGK